MSEFFKMDIFFVIASAGFVVLALLTALILWRVYRILGHVEHLSKQVALETEDIRKDIEMFRASLRAGKGRLTSLVGFVRALTKPNRRKKED